MVVINNQLSILQIIVFTGWMHFASSKASTTHLIQAGILIQREYVRHNNRRYRVFTKNKKKYIIVKNCKVFLNDRRQVIA